MHHSEYSTVDPGTGNMTYSGPLEITKGDHSNMPPRTRAYLSGDERGHINASSLGGTNLTINVAAQSRDVNHGAYYSMEQGERAALQSGAEINSTKTAVVNGSPGDRPEAFLVSDTITYSDGHTENISLSFTNASYAEQAAYPSLWLLERSQHQHDSAPSRGGRHRSDDLFSVLTGLWTERDCPQTQRVGAKDTGAASGRAM